MKVDFEGGGYIYLTQKNRNADTLNAEKLAALKGKPFTAEAQVKGTFGQEIIRYGKL